MERALPRLKNPNPHLIVTQVTAVDPNGPPVSKDGLRLVFRKLGMQPRRLRIVRLPDEAHETADPVHLMRVFGISDTTALKYVGAAHPHRSGPEPTQASAVPNPGYSRDTHQRGDELILMRLRTWAAQRSRSKCVHLALAAELPRRRSR